MATFEELKGKIILGIEGLEEGSSEAKFYCSNNIQYALYHEQDCCEIVYIEDVCGDIEDILNSEILLAEETTSEETPEGVNLPSCLESYTWTFYKIGTKKGQITIRWYGGSNGYYSEKVDFLQI